MSCLPLSKGLQNYKFNAICTTVHVSLKKQSLINEDGNKRKQKYIYEI
jgi:hypothetical protein